MQLQLIAQKSEWEGLRQQWRAWPATIAVPHDRRRHFGTGAYLIHRRGMQQLLEAFTVPPLPSGAMALSNTAGGIAALTSRRPAGSLAVPVDMDELVADVHLVYSLASPAFLATPPLISCAHSASTVEHHSAIRLTAQNAALENEIAHEVSETFARAWAEEALTSHQAAQRAESAPSGTPAVALPQVARVVGATGFAHHFCTNFDVMTTEVAPVQV